MGHQKFQQFGTHGFIKWRNVPCWGFLGNSHEGGSSPGERKFLSFGFLRGRLFNRQRNEGVSTSTNGTADLTSQWSYDLIGELKFRTLVNS